MKKQYKDRLTKALISDGDTMNYAYYEGKGIDVKRKSLILSETMPFSVRELIVTKIKVSKCYC